jgi:hypothetical protein
MIIEVDCRLSIWSAPAAALWIDPAVEGPFGSNQSKAA